MRELIKSAAALCAVGFAAASLTAVSPESRTVNVRASAVSVEAASVKSVQVVSDTTTAPELTLRVNDPLMQVEMQEVEMQATHDGAEKDWARVNFLPSEVTVKSVTVYAPGTSLATHYPTVTLNRTDASETYSSSAVSPAASETYFAGADGTYATAAAVTYTFDSPIKLTSAASYTLTFNPAKDANPSDVYLVGFKATHDHKGSALAMGTDTAYRPYVAVGGGTAIMNVYSAEIEDGKVHSLSDILPKPAADAEDTADSVDTLVELRFKDLGGTVTLDRNLKNAALFAYSKIPVGKGLPGSTAAEQSGTAVLKFPDEDKYVHTGPMTLSGDEGGGITLQAETSATSSSPSVALGTSAWNPKDFLVLCDVEQALLMPTVGGSETTTSGTGWFETHEVLIPAGRSWYVKPPWHSENERQLPTVAFGSADSRLVLAADHPIPEKYRTLMTKASGTLVLSKEETFSGDTTLGNADLEQHFESYGTTTFSGAMTVGKGDASDTTYHQHAGSTAVSGNVTVGVADAARAALMIYDGTFTGNSLMLDPAAHGLEVTVGDGEGNAETALLKVSAVGAVSGADATGNGTLTVAKDGRIEAGTVTLPVGANHTVLLDGGTFAAPTDSSATLTFGPGALRVTAQGGTLDANGSSLTVDRVTGGEGSGTLTAKGTVTVATLTDYDGTVQAEKGDPNANKLTLGTISGTSGTVTVGYLGYHKTDGSDDDGAALKAVTEAAETYQGTLAFTSQYRTLDFTQTEIRSFPYALAFSNGASADAPQHIIMRLDQYDGTTVRWPENPQNITLTLIETGSYGGEAFGLPAIPSGVTLEFASFKADGSGYTVREEGYVYTTDENGVTGSLTWENPVFTGNSAWIDCEFDGTSANTGWVKLYGQNGQDGKNGMLLGLPAGNDVALGANDEIMDATDAKWKAYFIDAEYPLLSNGAVRLYSRPYVSKPSLLYPEIWSVAVRVKAPTKANTCLLQIGANVLSKNDPESLRDEYEAKAQVGYSGCYVSDTLNSVVISTGTDAQTLVLSYVQGNSSDSAAKIATVTLADLTSAFHTVSMTCDGSSIRVYLDGAYLTTYVPADKRIALGPGLQIGSMLGGEYKGVDTGLVAPNLWKNFLPVTDDAAGGAIDYVRFYKGVLTDTAMLALAHEAPPVIKNVRYVRTLDATSDKTWVEAGKWQRQEWTSEAWVNSGDTVAEPAEGCEVYLIPPDSGTATLAVNVQLDTDNCFYSRNRLYSRLTIEDGKGGTVRIEPYAGTATDSATATDSWQTAMTGGDYTYGTIRFTGGVGQALSDASEVTDVAGLAGTVEIDGGVCRLDWDGVTLAAKAQVKMKAGLSLVRGEDAESKTYQLTGPVTFTEPVTFGNKAQFVTNKAADTDDNTATAVWLPVFGTDVDGWRFYDDTAADKGEAAGLFARAVQTPGRLYLDLTTTQTATLGETSDRFSAQAWYRYGYAGTAASETLSGMEPIEASPKDFANAIAFQIRVPPGGAALTMDKGVKVRNFVVDRAGTGASGTLTLTAGDSTSAVTVTDEVITHAVLDIAGGSDPALKLKGTELHGSDGELVMDGTVDWPLNTSSVGRLTAKAGKTLTLSGQQNLRTYNTVLAAQKKATLKQDGAANALLGADIELGEGATFAFAGTATGGSDTGGVRLSGALKLTGYAATLSGGDGALFAADGGIVGPLPISNNVAKLTVDAAEDITWSTPTSALTNLALWKRGLGTVDFRSQSAPTVTGPVTVEGGTLLVAPSELGAEETAGHTGAAVGHFGLTVKAGATLGQTTAASTAGRVLACIADGKRLSGTGKVDGILRLTKGAILMADDTGALTAGSVVTETGGPGDITVELDKDYGAGTVFLRSRDGTEKTVRRRLKSVKGAVLWDTIARHVTPEGASAADRTEYYARPGGVPWPDGDGEGQFDGVLGQELTARYRGEGRAYIGETKGRRPSKTENLTSAEISGAERCFTGISLFADRAGTLGSYAYVDGATYLVGFEYGITAMTVVTLANSPAGLTPPEDGLPEDGRYVILEVTVESHLKSLFGEETTAAADFRPRTDVEVTLGGAVCTQVAEVADLKGTPLSDNLSNRTPGKRYLAIPFSEALFGTGDASTKVSVRAVPPAAASAAQ